MDLETKAKKQFMSPEMIEMIRDGEASAAAVVEPAGKPSGTHNICGIAIFGCNILTGTSYSIQ